MQQEVAIDLRSAATQYQNIKLVCWLDQQDSQ
jgi:hypothetical protein